MKPYFWSTDSISWSIIRWFAARFSVLTGVSHRRQRGLRKGFNSDAMSYEVVSQDIVSFNSGKIIEYSYLVSHRHRDLRDAVSAQEGVSAAVDSLIEYASKEFFKCARSNFRMLGNYYRNTRHTPPRMCLKGNFAHEDGIHYVSIFRDSVVPYQAESELSTNSGFLHCMETGQYYVNNDLPSSVLRGSYHNPRISYQRVRNVLSNNLTSRRAALKANWFNLWPDATRTEQAYQSTLIVPMALWNSNLSDEFISEYGAEGADRLIYGFLCLDHHETGYFTESDIRISQIVADSLSQFAYNFFNYTIFSRTFRSAVSDDDLPREAILELIRKYSSQIEIEVERDEMRQTKQSSARNKLIELSIGKLRKD